MGFIQAFSYISYISTILMAIEQYLTHKDMDVLAENLRDVLMSALGDRVTRARARRILMAIAYKI